MGAKRIIVKKKNEMMLSELFDRFRVEKKSMGISEKTITNYQESVKRFLEVLDVDDLQMAELTKNDILLFIQILQEKDLRTETINHYLRDIRAFLNWCSKEGYLG